MISVVIPLYVNLEVPKANLAHYNFIGTMYDVVIIDDGSPISINYRDYPFLRFYRINEDKSWNQPQANNLGVSKAKHDTILRCDIDHIIKESFLNELQYKLPIEKGTILKFNRIKNGQKLPPNKNIFLINRSDWGEGYDERFCGHYGHDDTDFLRKRALKEIVIQDHILVTDIKTHNLTRDKSYNTILKDAI